MTSRHWLNRADWLKQPKYRLKEGRRCFKKTFYISFLLPKSHPLPLAMLNCPSALTAFNWTCFQSALKWRWTLQPVIFLSVKMEHGRANCCWLPLKDRSTEVEEDEQKMSPCGQCQYCVSTVVQIGSLAVAIVAHYIAKLNKTIQLVRLPSWSSKICLLFSNLFLIVHFYFSAKPANKRKISIC